MAERRESVRLELNDAGFSTGMVKNAAATGLLEKALKSLDGTTVNVHQSLSESATGVDDFGRSARDADGSINQLTGRLRVLGEVAAILGPALTPLGGTAIAGVAGLANQMGLAAVAGGVLIGSLQGVGDALGAMNKAQLEPTEKNLKKAREALEALSPAAREFTREAFRLKPALIALRDMGAEELMPGLTASLRNMEELGPRVAGIMKAVGNALGDIAEDSSASLASERWQGFFEFLKAEVPGTMRDLAATVGDLTHGLTELWMAFEPLNSDFSSWLMNVADSFEGWATGLSATEGFQEFIDYVRETGPQVGETLGAIANAAVQIVQATAPLGGPVLAGLEAFANAVSAIADSDLGTPILAGVAALSLLNRTLAVTASLSKVSMSSGLFAGLGSVSSGAKTGASSLRALGGDLGVLRTNFLTAGAASERMAAQNKKALDGIKGAARAVGPTAGLLGGLAVASTGAADGMGLTNTATLALAGSLAGPPGIALGAAAGLFLDWRDSAGQAEESLRQFDASLNGLSLEELNGRLVSTRSALDALSGQDFLGADDLTEQARSQVDLLEERIAATDDLAAKQVAQSRNVALAYASEIGLNSELAVWQHKSNEEIKAMATALGEVDDASRGVAESFLGLPGSLNKSKVSLRDFIDDMAEMATALRNFNDNALKAAKRGLDGGLTESLRQAGSEGALRMKQLANATESEIGRANKAYRSQQRELERTVDIGRELAGLSPVVKVRAETGAAMRDIEGLEARLRAIKDEDVNVVVRQIGATTLGPRTESADGGTVPKTGRPYADRHPYLLADGEEVISNRFGQADRHRDLLKSINAGRLADGGTAGDRKGDKPKKRHRFFDVNDSTAGLQAALDALTARTDDQTAALDGQRKALEKSTSAVEFWADKMSEVASGTVSGFNTGLFDKDSNPWASGAGGGALFNLNRDNAGLEARGSLQAQLAAAGLSADALAAVLSQGSNADLQGILNSGSAAQINAAFNQRAALQGSVGGAAGQLAYGGQYAAAQQAQQQATAAVTQQLAEVQRATAATQRMEARINTMAVQVEQLNATGPERQGAAAATGFVQGGNQVARRRRRDR